MTERLAKRERESCELLERAADTVTSATRMVVDVADLARFGECNFAQYHRLEHTNNVIHMRH